MPYVRMLTNALLGGFLGAAHLTLLVLFLNPHLPIWSGTTGAWLGVLALTYGLPLAAACYLVLLIRRLISTDDVSPGWLSVRLLAWVAAAATGGASALLWLNRQGFELALGPEAAERIELAAAALGAWAAALLALAVLYSGSGRRGSRSAAVLLMVLIGASFASSVRIRGAAGETEARPETFGPAPGFPLPEELPRVRMLLLDGASLDYITPAVAEGRLPNFGRILDGGASMHLTSVRPTQPGPAWVAVATGKYPFRNGIRSAATYRPRQKDEPVLLLPGYCYSHILVRLGLVSEKPHTAEAWRARPVWEILSRLGIEVGVVRWPVTHPAGAVNGYLVSDRFHESAGPPFDARDATLAYPPEWLPIAGAALVDARSEAPSIGTTPGSEREFEARDRVYARVAAALQARADSRLFAVRYQGLDAVGHRYLRAAMPASFGDVSEEERRRYGPILDRYYGYIDAEVGRAMDALGPDDLLLVVSAFGMEPVGVVRRLLARVLGDPGYSGTHATAPDGFMLGYGGPVARGRIPLGSIVDVTPTVLYFLGLPVGRDMDGYARTEMFDRRLTAGRPITFIPTYE